MMAASICCCQLHCRASPGERVPARWSARPQSQRTVTLPGSSSRQPRDVLAFSMFRRCHSRCKSASTSNIQSSDGGLQSELSTADALTQEEAWQLLLDFTRLNARGLDQSMLDSPAKRARLRQASLVCPERHSSSSIPSTPSRNHTLSNKTWI